MAVALLDMLELQCRGFLVAEAFHKLVRRAQAVTPRRAAVERPLLFRTDCPVPELLPKTARPTAFSFQGGAEPKRVCNYGHAAERHRCTCKLGFERSNATYLSPQVITTAMLFGSSNRLEARMKDSMKDQVKGKADELAGKTKEKVGRATDNASLEAEGQDQKVGGKIQKKVGQVKKVFNS